MAFAMITADATISTVTSPAHAMKLFGGFKKKKKKQQQQQQPAAANAGAQPTEQYSALPANPQNAQQAHYSAAGLNLPGQNTYDVVNPNDMLPFAEDAITLGEGVQAGAAWNPPNQHGNYGVFSTPAAPGAAHYEAPNSAIHGEEVSQHHGPLGYQNNELQYGQLPPEAAEVIYGTLPPTTRGELVYVELPPEEELQARAELETAVAGEAAAAGEANAVHEHAVQAELKSVLNSRVKR